MTMWRLLRNWSFDLTDDGKRRVEISDSYLLGQIVIARRGDLERIIECVTL